MIGIVIVSHSRKLAEGVLELAAQMTRGAVPMEAVGGIDDAENPIGTDPMQVLAAIESVAARADAGVLVVMDLGSALMSAETALDFLADDVKARVRLCAAPLVEGTVAAAVQAAAGAGLAQASAEAATAIEVKIRQLAPVTGEEAAPSAPKPQDAAPQDSLRLEVVVANKLGLHARPAANLVATAGNFRSEIRLAKGGASASAKSINQVALLSVRHGDTVVFTVSGPDAAEAVAALRALAADRFGERDEDVALAPAADAPASGEPAGADVFSGTPASAGYSVGPAWVLRAKLPEIARRGSDDTEAQIRELDLAIAAARAEIESIKRETERISGKASAAIFGVHDLILADAALRDAAVARISGEKVKAAYAWSQAVEETAAAYGALDDAYMRARAADVRDCGGRVLRILLGAAAPALRQEREAIVVAHDLAPSEVAGLDAKLTLGIVTEAGGATSHAAILARALGIPAVIGAPGCLGRVADGQVIALDGFTGTVWAAPQQSVRQDIAARRASWLEARREASARGAAPAVTCDGVTVPVFCNIGSPAEAAAALAAGAEGVGLFRTEFLFQERDAAPGEEEQYAVYVAAANAMQGRPVVIRTLDVGGDKPIRYLETQKEDNPFLGERGVRFCLARPGLFRTQLRALLRAAVVADIRIMYPMVSDVAELVGVLELQRQERDALAAAGLAVPGAVKTGIMIEVPAAVAVADKLAALCDFFSIGTNDLTQYVMAADRGNAAVAPLCDSLNPAVLRMIAMTCRAGEAAGIPVAMCGELAGEALAAPLLLGLGLKELSMAGTAVAGVKDAIRATDGEACRALADKALAADSAAAVRELLRADNPAA